jgi:outer membrane protein assembly factor BamB
VLDYDHAAQADALRCFSLADGSQLWKNSYSVAVKRNHGMSRTVPAIAGGSVVTLGPKCHLTSWDAGSGQVKWHLDLVQQFGATVPEWYAGQCPLVENGRVIVATGGGALLVAFDLASGHPVWQTPNPQGWRMSHSSVLPVTFAGVRMYVYCFKEGVVGLSAANGTQLWQTTDWRVSTATVPTPVDLGQGRLMLTGGYNAGAALLQLSQSGGQIQPSIAYRLQANVFGSAQHTPILYNGHLYGIIQNGQLVCLDLSGSPLWRSGHVARFGLGPHIIASGLIYALGEQGVLTLAEATPAGYNQLAQAKILDSLPAYGPMALVSGRLLARDSTRMVCLDVSG